MPSLIMHKSLQLVSAAALLVATSQADAQLYVYEPFQYGTAGANRAASDLLDSQPDGSGGDVSPTGLGGPWQEMDSVAASSDLFVQENSLSFGDKVTAGNHVRSDTNGNNDRFSNAITASLSAGSEMWFSVLANKLQNNFSAAEGGLVIGNQPVNNPRILLDTGSTGLDGFGVAPTSAGNNWMAYAWDGASQSTGGGALGVPADGSEVHLLVGKVSFDTGTAGADEYWLYDYALNAGEMDGGTLNQIGSKIEVDSDQTALDTLSLTRQVNTAYDEIRVGATLNDVLAIPPPPGTLFRFQ